MSIHARFIGKTSCGFVSGSIYDIRIYTAGRYVMVDDIKSKASCPYASIQAFAKNWEFPIKGE